MAGHKYSARQSRLPEPQHLTMSHGQQEKILSRWLSQTAEDTQMPVQAQATRRLRSMPTTRQRLPMLPCSDMTQANRSWTMKASRCRLLSRHRLILLPSQRQPMLTKQSLRKVLPRLLKIVVRRMSWLSAARPRPQVQKRHTILWLPLQTDITCKHR